eukprot:1161702-Pelagomonas_calceolata.AAC.7
MRETCARHGWTGGAQVQTWSPSNGRGAHTSWRVHNGWTWEAQEPDMILLLLKVNACTARTWTCTHQHVHACLCVCVIQLSAIVQAHGPHNASTCTRAKLLACKHTWHPQYQTTVCHCFKELCCFHVLKCRMKRTSPPHLHMVSKPMALSPPYATLRPPAAARRPQREDSAPKARARPTCEGKAVSKGFLVTNLEEGAGQVTGETQEVEACIQLEEEAG